MPARSPGTCDDGWNLRRSDVRQSGHDTFTRTKCLVGDCDWEADQRSPAGLFTVLQVVGKHVVLRRAGDNRDDLRFGFLHPPDKGGPLSGNVFSSLLRPNTTGTLVLQQDPHLILWRLALEVASNAIGIITTGFTAFRLRYFTLSRRDDLYLAPGRPAPGGSGRGRQPVRQQSLP